jgi:hypothetical protein
LPHPSAVSRAADEAARSGKAWRLPTMKELSAIASVAEADPTSGVAAIDATAFPGTPALRFWTSSSAGPHYFMYVGFKDADVGEACCSTSSTAASCQVGRVLVLAQHPLDHQAQLARTLSRCDQSTVMFLRRFSVSSWAIFLRVSSVSSRTADSLLASAS